MLLVDYEWVIYPCFLESKRLPLRGAPRVLYIVYLCGQIA
jgi:hypothetical protein